MKISETKARQIIDTLIVKNGTKDFKPSFFLKQFNLKRIKVQLDPMMRAYNHFVSKMLESYGVSTYRIYDEFDRAWEEVFKHPIYTYKPTRKFAEYFAEYTDLVVLERNSLMEHQWEEYKEKVMKILKYRLNISKEDDLTDEKINQYLVGKDFKD